MTTVEASLAQPAERVIARLRPHARALFWPSIVLIACCAAVGYWGGNLPDYWQNMLVFTGAGLIVLVLFLLPLGSWLSTRYTITTRRIILRHGFFVRERQELLHSRSYGVSVKKNWLQAAFGSGDLRIDSGGDGPVVLRDVPKANLVQGALHDLMESSQNLLNARR
ncbi:MAG TPA: PH domain-containing protein, partial [Microbacteriaceae bacterium]